MIENYYKILGVNINSGAFKISFNYLKLSKRIFVKHPSILERENLRQINRAYSVLSQSNPRKFYNIMYSQFLKGTLDYNDQLCQKYLNILEPIINEGNSKAEKLLDMSRKEDSAFHQSWFSFYHDYLLYPGFRFRGWLPSAFLAYFMIFASIINLFTNHNLTDKIYMFIGLNIISTSIMVINFRKFILTILH